jgi:hypothetical protein
MVLMKRLLYILAALMLITATGCKKDEKPIDCQATLPGEWHCTPEGIDADIYAAFNVDGSFDLYQKAGEGRYRHYTGTWECKGNTLSGDYSDGTPWGSDYTVNFSDQDNMTFTALNGSEEIMAYTRESVPTEVKAGCIDVKSSFGMLNSQPQYRWL